MKNNISFKKYLLIALILLIFLLMAQNASAFFTKSHTIWNIRGFEQVDSAITRECRGMFDVFMDGDTAADVMVLHYYDQNIASYIATHTRGAGYDSCLREAGSDSRKRCFCYGLGAHFSAQDRFSHLSGGLVPKYLESGLAPNFVGHMIIERDFEKGHVALVNKNEPSIYNAMLTQDTKTLNQMYFENSKGELENSDLVTLLNDVSGIDATNDIAIFRTGYRGCAEMTPCKKGGSFFNTVYKDKVRLPIWVQTLAYFLVLIGAFMIFALIFWGRTKWKFLAIINWIVVLVIGLIIVYSFFTATTWQVTTFFIEQPPKLGWLNVAATDVAYLDQQAQEATNEFLRTGQILVDDGSGLSYYDSKNNQHVEGALNIASKPFIYVFFFLFLPIFVGLNIWVLYKTFNDKTKRKR